MIFENGRQTQYDFILNNYILDVVTNFKYLGITLFKNGKWTRTEKSIADKALYAIHNLFIVFNQVEMSTKDKCVLFDSLVSSMLNYGAKLFDF